MGKVVRVLVLLLIAAAVVWGGRSRLVWVRALQPRADTPDPALATIETTKVTRGPFTISVTSSGKLRAWNTETVQTERMEGKLVWIAADGAPVKKGDVIARLDDEEYKRQVRDITLELENAKAEIEKQGRDRALEQRNSEATVEKANEERRILLQSNEVQLKQARAELDFRTAEHERLTSEFNRKKRHAEERLIPRAQLEEAEIALQSAAYAADKAKKDLELQEQKAAAAVQQKETELENARFQVETQQRRVRDEADAAQSKVTNIQRRLDDAKQRLEWCTLRAPISGLLVLVKDWYPPGERRVPRAGDQLWGRKSLADIPDLTRMAIDVKVAERQISAIRPGQAVLVRLDERPSQPFHGQVAAISSVAQEVSPWDDLGFDPGTRVFTVTVELKERDPKRLIPGMNATVEVVTRRIATAVHVPKGCVFERGAEHVVYTRRAGRFTAVVVQVGEQNATNVCIKRGLKGGESVATSDPSRVVTNG